MINMTIILGPSTNPITNRFTTELDVYKQQQTPTDNYKSFQCFVQYLSHPTTYVY